MHLKESHYMTKASWYCAVLLTTLACSGTTQGALLKSYDFNGTLSDTLGNGVDLTDSGGSISGGRYSFTQNQGLQLTSALPSTTDYGIEIRLQGTDALSGYNKLIDFQDLAVDVGLYVLNEQIRFYTAGPTAAGTVALNTDFTVGLARSSGTIEVFLNGTSLYSFADGGQGVPGGNILNFFEDDFGTSQGEAFAGSVEFIRIHNDSSTFGVAPSFNPGPSIPEPATLSLFGLGLLGCASWLSGAKRSLMLRRG